MSIGVCYPDPFAVEVEETFKSLSMLWEGYVPACIHYNRVIFPMGDVSGCTGNLIDLMIQDVKRFVALSIVIGNNKSSENP
jgi:hypothetical protein